MEIVKLTVSEATEAMLMSQSSVYNWIEKGKFETELTEDGKVIVITPEEIDKIKARNVKSRRNKVSKKLQEDSNDVCNDFQQNTVNNVGSCSNEREILLGSNEPFNNSQQSSEMLQEVTANNYLEMMKEIKDLAMKAGKYELLEDKSKDMKADVEHWQKEYFEVRYKYEALQEKFDKLQEDYNTLLENSKKPWWKKKV